MMSLLGSLTISLIRRLRRRRSSRDGVVVVIEAVVVVIEVCKQTCGEGIMRLLARIVAVSNKDLGQTTTIVIKLMVIRVIEVVTRAIEVAIKITRSRGMMMKDSATSPTTITEEETKTATTNPEASTATKTLEANTSPETRTELMMRVSSRFVAAVTTEVSSKVVVIRSSDPTHPSSKLATWMVRMTGRSARQKLSQKRVSDFLTKLINHIHTNQNILSMSVATASSWTWFSVQPLCKRICELSILYVDYTLPKSR